MSDFNNSPLKDFWVNLKDLFDTKADKTDIPTKTSQLTNDAGFLTTENLPIYEGDIGSRYEGEVE